MSRCIIAFDAKITYEVVFEIEKNIDAYPFALKPMGELFCFCFHIKWDGSMISANHADKR